MQAVDSSRSSFGSIAHPSHRRKDFVNEVECQLRCKVGQLFTQARHKGKGLPGDEPSFKDGLVMSTDGRKRDAHLS